MADDYKDAYEDGHGRESAEELRYRPVSEDTYCVRVNHWSKPG
ncbi:hypothetical protein GGGNBK_02475 [Sporosarcina sp. ANT_H38]|nr:hypothetical protein [Sporosarcina sp. ANT_H38]